MDKEYIKELDRAYLVLGGDQIDEDEYALQMAMRGKLPGILPLSVAAKDGKKSLRADVTACASIVSRYKSVELTGSDLRKILSAVRDTARKMPGLLMSVRDLYLDPECVFLGPGGDEVLVCYIPHISDTEPDSIHLLSEFFLKKVDHSDQAASHLAYTLYDQVSADSCDLSDVLRNLLQGNESDFKESASSGYASASGTSFISGTSERSGASSYSGFSSHPGVSPYPGTSPYSGASSHSGFSSHPGDSPYPGTSSMEDGPVFSQESRYRGSAYSGGSNYSGGSEYEEFSRANVRKLPPPGQKKRNGRARSSRSSGKGSRASKAAGKNKRRNKRGRSLKFLLPAAIILPCAGIAIVFFRMDLTQICGMGFLCAALIWMIHSSLEKRSNEGHNVWFDDEEDLESDEQFYQSLRKELYAEDSFSAGQAPYPRDQQFAGRTQYAEDSFSAGHAPYPQDQRFAQQAPYPQDQQFAGRAQYEENSYPAWQAPYPRDKRSAGQPERTGSEDSASREEMTRMLRTHAPSLLSLKKESCPDITLDRDYLILGKSRSQADIILPGNTVSRRHARIERRMDGYYITDLFSTNGTFLDGHRLESGQAVALKDGAQLTIASCPYRVVIPEPDPALTA